MSARIPFIFFIFLALAMTTAWLSGQTQAVDFAGKKATGLGQQSFDKKMWSTDKNSTLMQKTFPMKEWGKHYSSLGSKRSAIGDSQWGGSKKYATKTKEFPIKELKISDWTEKLANLQEQALISTDMEARKIAETQLYGAMLQDPTKFETMAEELSLRDINRFQFRRNRPAGELPVQKAGAGE